VIYTSKYGATKQYATWIAEALDGTLAEARAVKPDDLSAYDAVVYGGGLYAGGIAGVKLVKKNPCKNLVVFTVGLADPAITDYSECINKAFTPECRAKIGLFHLRGGIDYRQLSLLHKGMMAMMRKSILKKPQADRNAEDKLFLQTYGGRINFVRQDTIGPLVDFVKEV
jgi:hypothetical protein